MMLLLYNNVQSGGLNNADDDRYDFNFLSAENLECHNGYDIFIKNENLYAIVWEAVGIIDVGYNSRLLIKKKNDKQWSVIEIPGKAYYLGETYNNEICSIKNDMKSNTWDISFYDLEGKILRNVEHKYKVFSREYFHYEPVPLCYDDGSMIFYTVYKYETRDIMSKFLLNIFGGHGSLRGVGEYVEIVPELINKNSKRKSFSYERIIDSSGLRRVLPLNRNIPEFDLTIKRAFTVGDYKITAYELEDRNNTYYINNGSIIKTSDKMEIYNLNSGVKIIVPMPSIDNAFLIDGKLKYNGSRSRGSDVWSESEGVFLAIKEIELSHRKRIIIYSYNVEKKQWMRDTTINSGYENYRHLTIYKKADYLFLGLWGNYRKFRIMKYKIQ